MKVSIRADSVLIEGYVNAIERNSKPLMSRIGRFIERICKGAFSNALKRNDDVHVLVDHDWNRDIGSTKQGNLELREDNIGLHARLETDDAGVVKEAREGNLVGWSFGFEDTPNGVEEGIDSETGLPLRKVRDLNLYEVSILTRKKVPAYDGTLIMARSEDDTQFFGEAFLEELEIRETEEIRESDQPQLEEHPEANKTNDYSIYEAMILEMKGETK